jgi:hypothetical protein
MNCNAGAFAVGDEVLVKFENQDWNQPKVVGFKSSPATCGTFFYQIFGWSGSQFKTNMIEKTWETIPPAAINPDRSDVGTTAIGAGALCIGGWWSDPIEKYNTVDLLSGAAFVAKTDVPGDGRGQISAFEISDYAFAVGGSNYYTGSGKGWTTRYKINYRFDPDANSWAGRQDIPQEMDALSGHNINGLGYCFGAGNYVETLCQDFGNYFMQADDYNFAYAPASDSWGNRQSMTYAQFSRIQFGTETQAFIAGSACYPNHPGAINPIYDCGGGSYEWAVTEKLQRYDADSNSWSIRGDMDDFSADAQYPGVDKPMSATVTQHTRGAADSFEQNGYIHTRTINGTGLIKWDTTAEVFSLFSDQEPYEPCATCGTGQYSSGCVA